MKSIFFFVRQIIRSSLFLLVVLLLFLSSCTYWIANHRVSYDQDLHRVIESEVSEVAKQALQRKDYTKYLDILVAQQRQMIALVENPIENTLLQKQQEYNQTFIDRGIEYELFANTKREHSTTITYQVFLKLTATLLPLLFIVLSTPKQSEELIDVLPTLKSKRIGIDILSHLVVIVFSMLCLFVLLLGVSSVFYPFGSFQYPVLVGEVYVHEQISISTSIVNNLQIRPISFILWIALEIIILNSIFSLLVQRISYRITKNRFSGFVPLMVLYLLNSSENYSKYNPFDYFHIDRVFVHYSNVRYFSAVQYFFSMSVLCVLLFVIVWILEKKKRSY